MSGWRHEEEADDGRCRVDVEGLPCGCYPPTPDPTWGCAKCGLSERVHIGRHGYQPTRCATCGHPIRREP